MKLKIILFTAIFSAINTMGHAQAITCSIKGTVENRNSKALYLMKATADPRSDIKIHIPIQNNTFEYKFTTDEQEAFQLIFDEEWDEMSYKPVIFFPDSAEVRLKLYSSNEAEERNIVTGGTLNRSYRNHLTQFSSAFKTEYLVNRQKRRDAIAGKSYFNPAYESLKLLLKSADNVKSNELAAKLKAMEEDGSDLTESGKAIRLNEQQILEKMYAFRYEYIQTHPTPVSYYLIYEDLNRDDDSIFKKAAAAYKQLAKAMPQHSYTTKLGHFISGLRLKPGEAFIDFEAPDLYGRNHLLSSLMKGKLTLLDLWASWCGPCIAKTREVLPLYHEFKDKGFEVIGVAREFKDLNNLKSALNREKHPWITLVELEDKHLIWNKYGADLAGGKMILFDDKGTILAINPTVDELKEVVKRTLE